MDHSTGIFQESLAQAAGSALWRLIGWPLRVAAARQAMRQLAGMSTRELADIGLMRQDLNDASALALGGDPTAMLAARAEERKRRRQFGPFPAITLMAGRDVREALARQD